MTDEIKNDLDAWMAERKEWAPFKPIVTLENFGKVAQQVSTGLNADISDCHYDLKRRRITMINKQAQVNDVRQILLSPELDEHLATLSRTIQPGTPQHTNFKITQLHYVPSANLWPRQIKMFKVFLEIENRDGSPIVKNLTRRMLLEDRFMRILGRYLMSIPGYRSYDFQRDAEFLKIFNKNYPKDAFYIGFSYDQIVSYSLLPNMFIRACECFFPNLERLTFAFISIMWEFFSVENNYGYREPAWFLFEKCYFLVIFFLQQCRLIPQIMRETDVFVNFLTWPQVHEWDRGARFFTVEYFQKKKIEIAQSPFAEKTLGELLVGLIHFHSVTVPLGTLPLYLDRVEVGKTKSDTVFSFIVWKSELPRVVIAKIALYREILSKLFDYLRKTEEGVKVAEALIQKRRKLQEKHQAKWKYNKYDVNPALYWQSSDVQLPTSVPQTSQPSSSLNPSNPNASETSQEDQKKNDNQETGGSK